jgi:hypothetical protein
MNFRKDSKAVRLAALFGGIDLRLAIIVSCVVLATTVVTVLAAYLLNKLNRS